nr:hypothetical protein Q903MT_gene1684 [Picea sitchensis]
MNQLQPDMQAQQHQECPLMVGSCVCSFSLTMLPKYQRHLYIVLLIIHMRGPLIAIVSWMTWLSNPPPCQPLRFLKPFLPSGSPYYQL